MISGKLLLAGSVMAITAILLWNASRIGNQRTVTAPVAGHPQEDSEGSKPTTFQVIAEGRVVTYPGAEVIIGTEFGGLIIELPVREKSIVHQGDLVARLRDDDLQASLAAAQARIAEAKTDIQFYERQLHRARRLHSRQAGTQVDVDQDRRNLELARARQEAAIAEKDYYEALLAKTRMISPISGVVIDRFVHPGETVEPATRLVRIADLSQLRIEAEVDEYDVGKIALGAAVRIRAEGYEGTTWRGTIEEIPDTVVSRRIRPEDPSRPIDTRVLLVKVAVDEPTPLKLGQRVEVEIRLLQTR